MNQNEQTMYHSYANPYQAQNYYNPMYRRSVPVPALILLIISAIGGIVWGVHAVVTSAKSREQKGFFEGSIAFFGGFISLVLWILLISFVFNSGSIDLGASKLYTQSDKNTSYSLLIPESLKEININGIDGEHTFVATEGKTYRAFARASVTYIGARGVASALAVSSSLQDDKTAAFQQFASAVSQAPDYTNFKLGPFSTIEAADPVAKLLGAPVSFVDKTGNKLIGKAVISYGVSDQYFFVFAAEKAIWEKNSDTWGKTIRSIKVK
jgi:hypothetical protein